MSVKTNPRRKAVMTARRTPCYLGGRLHNRKDDQACKHCGATR